METVKEVNNVMSELQSGYGNGLYGALIMIRTTLIKSRSAVNQLIQLGAVQLLIQLLEERRHHVNPTKTTDIVMSILANLCLDEDVRARVVCCDGLSVIARVTLSSEQESVQNRGVRALANLAQDVDNCGKIFDLEVPAFVAKRLMETEDVECRSTYCRALQLFGQAGKDAKRLMEETQAIQALAALLKLENRKLALKSLRILSELSAVRCCPNFTGQILAANILEELVTLADDEDSSPASYSLSIILRLCEQEITRPALGSAGVISLLVKLMKSDRSYINKVWTLNALCLCTKEAVNRNKIQEAGGLELFISALNESRTGYLMSDGYFSVLYDRIISSLVNFLYNDDCLGKLLELGLVRILTDHLKRSCTFTSLNEDLKKEVDSLAVLLGQSETTAGRERLLKKVSNTEIGNLSYDSIYLEGECVQLAKNSTSCSTAELGSVSVHPEGESQSFETENIAFPSDSNNPIPVNQIVEAYESLPKQKLNTGDEDPLDIDSNVVTSGDAIVVDDDDERENAASPDNVDLPFQQTNPSRHTFSINSPTYQSETSWRLEDYTSGVTCKSFSQEQETYRATPHYPPSPYSVNTDMVQAPYSPLSAGASYYSPSQSSPSHSVLMSPLQSTIPSSPTSTSYRGSPAWAYSSPDNLNSPVSPSRLFSPRSTASSSPLPFAFQTQFSPLSNDFPGSPMLGENHSQSPTPNSQSLFSQDTSVPDLETHMGSVVASSHIEQLLAASREASAPGILFTAVPVSQDSVAIENVYSASEDDEDVGSDVDSALKTSPIDSECGNDKLEMYHKMVADSSPSIENMKNSTQLLSNKRFKTVDTATSSENNLFCVHDEAVNSKRRKLNNKSSAMETVRGICDIESAAKNIPKVRHSSDGFIPDLYSSDDEEIINLSSEHHSSTVLGLKTDESGLNLKSTLPSLKTDKMGAKTKEMYRPSSTSSDITVVSEKSKSVEQMTPYLGKGKLPISAASFRKHHSAVVSPTPRLGMSPLASTQPISEYQVLSFISDSPYRSPYPETAHNSIVSNDDLKVNVETTEGTTERNSKKDFANRSLSSQEKSSNTTKLDDSAVTSRSLSVKAYSTSDIRYVHNTSDARVKKIHRTTETNILILLARVSVKTNPTHLLADATVMSCMLGYISSAPNPIRRSCRILHRLCSNPHCFEKLVLMQMPAMLVKCLVLEKDGTFPHDLFCRDNRNMSDLLLSSQGSEGSGSQTSEFGRKMDFEFGGDAYSRMTSKKHLSVGSVFRNRPSLSVDSEAARDGLNGGDDIYETGSSRAEVRLRIGLELLHTMGAVAMSNFGEGELKHLLIRRSEQDKLACMMSMLHLRVGWCHTTRNQFFNKYSLWEKILPCLFTLEAPLVREAIVAAISLNVHLDNPTKLTQKISKLPICPDLDSQSTSDRKSKLACSAESKRECSNSMMKPKVKLSLKKSNKMEILTVRSTSLEETSNNMVDHINNLLEDEHIVPNSQRSRSIDHTMDYSSGTSSLCQHQNMNTDYDFCFFIHCDNGVIHKVSALRKMLIEKSEVFAAMFCGSYAESAQSEIVLRDVNSYAFEFIIHYLHGCSSGCSVIDSLSLESTKGEMVAKEVSIKSDSVERQEMESMPQLDEQVLNEENVEEMNSFIDNRFPSGKQNVSRSFAGDIRKSNALSSMKIDTSEYISPLLELAHSQDSLDSLTLEDRPESEKMPNTSRKLNFKYSEKNRNYAVNQNDTDMCQKELSGSSQKCLDELISKCGNIFALADRYLLHDLMRYPASVLSHVCLSPHTIEDIFHLACCYKLDSLAFDCIRETLMSRLPCNDAAAIYVELAADGFKEQVYTALTWLLNYMQSD